MPPKLFRAAPTRLARVDARPWRVRYLVFASSLFLPAMAVVRLTKHFDPRVLTAWVVMASVCGYVACYRDKRKAQSGRWRTPEATLHSIELLGGWPGSFVAQRQFHHKTVKTSYQVVFWAIVSAYQLAAVDFLQDWHFSRSLVKTLASL